ESLLAIHSAPVRDVRLAVFLLGAELLLSIPMGIIGGSYRATGHLARAAFISAAQRTTFFACPLIAISFGANFAAIGAIRVGIGLLFGGIIIADLRRLHPWWHLRPLGGSLRQGLLMLAPGLLFVLLVFSDYLSQQSAIFILQHVSGPEAVSRFATH